MNIAWRHYRIVASGGPGGAIKNIGRGYFKLAYHLWNRLSKLDGVCVVDAGAEGSHPRLVFHLCPPHIFSPVPGKTNVLMSMWEGDALPREALEKLRLADHNVVPSQYCAAVWRHHGIENVSVVPLGVGDEYVNCNASRQIIATPSRTLRFLYLGSALARKGWELIAPAWQKAFTTSDRVQLTVKTVGDGSLKKLYGGRIVIDMRDLDEKELFELYQSTDVFLFPSFGEGFGLPALEAMASGALVIAPAISGLTEFVSAKTALLVELGAPVVADYGGLYKARFPTVDGLAKAMRIAAINWGTYGLELLRANGVSVARQFTWGRTAKMVAAVFERVAGRLAPEEVESALVH